jgi:hypothetical protein
VGADDDGELDVKKSERQVVPHGEGGTSYAESDACEEWGEDEGLGEGEEDAFAIIGDCLFERSWLARGRHGWRSGESGQGQSEIRGTRTTFEGTSQS